MDEDDNRSITPKLNLGEVSRSSSPVVNNPTPYPVSVRQQMARIKQMEQPSPSGSTDGEQAGPLTPGGVTPGGGGGGGGGGTAIGPGRRKAPKVHRRNGRGETPLHVAAKKGDVVACEQLVADGAEVNQSDNAGWTPLHEAASNNRVDCVLFLLSNGANPNARSQFGDLPLHDAVHCNYVRLVWTLLKAGAEVDSRCLTDNQDNQTKEDQTERARKVYNLLTSPLPLECPESEEEEDSEEERKKEKEKERDEKEGGKEKKDKRKKKDKEEKKKHKESSTPRGSSASDKYSTSSASASSSRTTVTTAATTVFESPQSGGGTSAGGMHAPHLPSSHHTTPPSMAAAILKATEQPLSVSTEHSERRMDDLPSSSRSIPATTPISVIVEGGREEEEEEEGEIKSQGERERHKSESETVPSSSLLSIADDVIVEDDDDDSEGKLMIDEGEDEDTMEGEEESPDGADTCTPSILLTPIVNVQPPTPVVEKRMELLALERDEDERDSVTRDSDPIDEMGEETSSKDPSSSRAFSEDPPSSSSIGTGKKRKKAGDKPGRKSEKGASKRSSTGIGAWAKNRRSAEPEMSSSAAAAAAAMMADDPFEFHDSSPDSRMSRGVTMDRELSAPPVHKRQRLSRTQSPSPSREMDMDDDDDEETRQSMGSKKVPPLRLVLPPKQNDDDGDEAIASSSYSTPIPSQPRKQGRGRPAGRRTGDDEGSAQRMTRSKVRQSGRGLDENEGGGKRKRGRQSLAAVVEEETVGEEAEGDYSTGATPLIGGGMGEGGGERGERGERGEMMGAEIDWNIIPPQQPDSLLEQRVYEITTQSTHLARANLDGLVNSQLAAMYQADKSAPQWQPSPVQLRTFLFYNSQYTIASRPPPPGGWPPMVSAQEIAEEAEEGGIHQEAGPSTSAASAPTTEPSKPNPFEEIREEMQSLWDELEAERARKELEFEDERVRLRLSLERSVLVRERAMKEQMDSLTFCKYLEMKETCNPHSLLDKQKFPNVERDVTRFVTHLESRVEELWKRQRFNAGSLAGMQISKWRMQAMRLGIKRGMKRQVRAFPEIVPPRVPIPPIEDYRLPAKPSDGGPAGK